MAKGYGNPFLSIETNATPADLMQRLERAEKKLDSTVSLALEDSMRAAIGSVPPYPPKPKTSWYVRTGRLARSLGSSMSGGQYIPAVGRGIVSAKPDVYTRRQIGPASYEGNIGSNVWYAERVLVRQEAPWKYYWWNEETWGKKSFKPIVEAIKKQMANFFRYLEGLND